MTIALSIIGGLTAAVVLTSVYRANQEWRQMKAILVRKHGVNTKANSR